MRIAPLIYACFCGALLAGCGAGPEPDYLEGEEQAAAVVSAFLTAVAQGDDEEAAALRYSRPDYIIGDLERCRELFFEQRPTGRSVMAVGRELYAHEWQIYVDMKLTYGAQMKQLHFILDPGEIPKVRSVTPIVPEGQE